MNDLALLAPRGLSVLPQSHLVPVDVWLRDASGALLHLTGRGTTLRLRAYDATDLTAVLLRSECDCRAHREAGAAHRVALRPGATPVSEAAYDGATRHGWTGIEAAMLRGEALAAVLRDLLGALGALGAPAPAAHAPSPERVPTAIGLLG